jgi:uncharacterized repeat protein (TIGR03803 family)
MTPLRTLTLNSKTATLLLVLALLLAATWAHGQTFSVLYNLGTNTGDPIWPTAYGLVTQGRDGNLYSAAPSGGDLSHGAVFKTTPNGQLTKLYSFTGGLDGHAPFGGLTLGKDGNFYGTTYEGGTHATGTIFKITPRGVLTTLYNFQNGDDGSYPVSPPILATDGNFYGVTSYANNQQWGAVYKITSAGQYTKIYTFDGTHGNFGGSLIQASDGNFYGTTFRGGICAFCGTIFKITRSGQITTIYKFDGLANGDLTYSLVQGSDGNLYGATYAGGVVGAGIVFKLTLSGVLTKLHDFLSTDGNNPVAGLVQGTDGYLYGATRYGGTANRGVLYRIKPNGTTFSVLYNFDFTTGRTPSVTPFQHTTGNFYSDTYQGGNFDRGVIYRLATGAPSFVSPIPWWGKVGASIGLLGQGFTGTTEVSFNGTPATFTVVSNTYLTATVPDGATTGLITVVTPSTSLTSNRIFLVTPFIASFDPTSGPVGTPVTITGTSFTGATKVTFGGVKATTFSVDSDTQITAIVPNGAKTGKIQVTTPGGTATSASSFVVTH